MKLFDVNVLVHAHREENRGHDFYRAWLEDLLAGEEGFLYCEIVLSAFIRIVTHPRIYRTPTPVPAALEFAEVVRGPTNGMGIMPGARHWEIFKDLCGRGGVAGSLVPDAYLAALAIEANAEWVTADRDFERFEPDLDLRLLRP